MAPPRRATSYCLELMQTRLPGGRNFAAVIQLRLLRWESTLDYPGELSNNKVLIGEMREESDSR